MNGRIKFHKANGPAFAVGERWEAADGSGLTCEIIGVRKYGAGKWDYRVSYRYKDGATCQKDAWPFQVRYKHVADKCI